MLDIHSFIHLGNLYSTSSRNLLRDAPSPTMVKKISFKQFVDQRLVALFFSKNRICKGSEFHIEGTITENAQHCIVKA